MNWTDEQRELTARNLSREVRWWNWDHPSFEGERQRWLAEADEFLADLAAVSAGPTEYQWATQVGGLIMPARDEREARSLLSGKPKRRTVGEWEDVPDAE